jgi:hypothetical protein
MLYKRITTQGTINEPNGKPDPQFALPATVNWMHALRLLTEHECINFNTATSFYLKEGKRSMDETVENTVFEQLFLGLHHLSALNQMRQGASAADYARIGVLAWYYGITNAASAMTAAKSGSFQEDHAGTARLWDEQIASRGLAMGPFSWRVSSLVKENYGAEVDAFRNSSKSTLQSKPLTANDAEGAAAGYLSGAAKWYSWKTEEDLKRHHDFKALKVQNFRTKKAQGLRDEWLSRKSIGFVHQAARYRGKANYREALFLAYGSDTETKLSGYIEDMYAVLKAFLAMAGAFSSRKIGKQLWSEFVADVEARRAFTISPSEVWS